ncbi:formylglycine-generating enzyme family protein [Testudinibacter sp. P27/CKL/0425]
MRKLTALLAISFSAACSADTPNQAEQGAAAVVERGAPFENVRNRLGMEFVAIPAGQFVMGSNETGVDRREQPAHTETIARPFYLAQHEVTQADWENVMGENPYVRDRSNPYYNLPGMAARITRPNHPATVSWRDAQEFIARLNAQDTQYRYRLPTEAEWEYAARAGSRSRYFFGDSRADLGRYAWFGEDFASGGTHPVGQKAPNPWGLYDIYGNAWEWGQDAWRADYASAPTGDKTVRGGSWHSTAGGWYSAWRKPYSADYRGISIGFRLVAEPK